MVGLVIKKVIEEKIKGAAKRNVIDVCECNFIAVVIRGEAGYVSDDPSVFFLTRLA